jgi:hypothetical protein
MSCGTPWLLVNSTRVPGGTTSSIGLTTPFAPMVIRCVFAGGLGPAGGASEPPQELAADDHARRRATARLRFKI